MTPKFTITNAITAGLTRIERARGFLEAATLSEDWVRAMGERALVLEADYTTHIEGTQLILDRAERLLAGEGDPEDGPGDGRELVRGHMPRGEQGGPSEGIAADEIGAE